LIRLRAGENDETPKLGETINDRINKTLYRRTLIFSHGRNGDDTGIAGIRHDFLLYNRSWL